MITDTKEVVRAQIEKDLLAIKELINSEQKYSNEPLTDIVSRVSINTKQLKEFEKPTIEVGKWVQLHSGGEDVVYAKVKSIKDFYVILVGIYNFDALGNRTPNAFPLEWCLPVKNDIGRLLEYANGNNQMFHGGII